MGVYGVGMKGGQKRKGETERKKKRKGHLFTPTSTMPRPSDQKADSFCWPLRDDVINTKLHVSR